MRRATRLSLGIGVTGVATAWFVSRAHWAEVGAALGGLRLGWVAAAAAVLYLEFVLRALRWRSLLWELAPGATFAPLFRATVIGMGLNVALPFRAGDVARPVLGARACRAPVLPFLALAGVERVLDLLGLGAVFVTMVATLPASLRGRGLMVDELERYGTLAVAAALVAFAALVAVAMQRERAAALLVRLAGVLPARVRGRVTPAIDGVVAGLGAVGSGRALAEAGALTLVHWAMGVLSWACFSSRSGSTWPRRPPASPRWRSPSVPRSRRRPGTSASSTPSSRTRSCPGGSTCRAPKPSRSSRGP